MADTELWSVKYSIDTSALIGAYREHYPPDVFPPVWAFMAQLVEQDVLGASEEVLHELEVKDDELLEWARSQRSMFRATTQSVQLEVQSILGAYPRLVDADSTPPAADPFVIALARIEGCSVVTPERHTRNPQRPHIPDVCDGVGIRCLPLVAMFREEGKTF